MTRGVKVNIDLYLTNIEPFLKVGCSLPEACLHGAVPYTTVKDYYDKEEDIRKKIDCWKNWDILLARQSVVNGLQEDSKLAMDYLKNKKSDEFGTKQKIDAEVSISFLDLIDETDR